MSRTPADEFLMLRIANARADYAAESHFPPSSSMPVLMYEWDKTERMLVPDPGGSDVSQIGKTLSRRMHRVLSRSYGADIGVRRALERLEPWCHRRHVVRREPLHEERGYVCPRLARYVVVTCNGAGEHGIEEAWMPELRNNWYRRLIRKAAMDEGMSYAEAADLIAAALIQMGRWQAEWQSGAA